MPMFDNPHPDPVTYCIPSPTAAEFLRYIHHHIPTGGFLEAVISNNLKESFARADETNQMSMARIVSYLYNYAPMECWGSPEKYKAWIENRGQSHD